ncbi:MAG: TSUP family transporter [Enhydrobacter sp.]|nr:MAG: TSUP family transporter [Enhydrobacter sp.]
MLTHIVIAATALIVSGLTLFSGFGLGTILMPAFALFFPVSVAIPATAVVHLVNNLFKLFLVGRQADWKVVARFGLPAALAAVAGAWLLGQLGGLPVLARYGLLGEAREIEPVKLVIGVVIVAFALLELSPRFAELSFPPRYLAAGGLVSGFFGGLSGNQGAFRSAFLLKAGLDKEAFVATGVVTAVVVDTVRLFVYGLSFYATNFAAISGDVAGVVATAIVAAAVGAWLGARLLKKVTLRLVQLVVAFMMIVVGLGLASGVL